MTEPGNAASRRVSGEPSKHHVDDTGVPLWSEADAEPTPGRNWSIILVFVFVPLMALAVLVLCLYALFAHLFGMPQAPEMSIGATRLPS
ncbi:hypothetical protein JNB71_12550 [Rhizobium herbae]|uniref:Uncharacterized protein n=1 Tax=Rhizobium herbae TaxID=508661 RepID=A0ABS7HA48_9HYPH|nr:hypothetical protein [Rhizobium herbae]MBW9064149.1 hypothetical protein [Rhizobium herbae]